MVHEIKNMLEKEFIDWVEKQLGVKIAIEKEKHGDQSDVFRIKTSNGNYFLKIAPDLKREQEKLKWLNGKLPVPKIIGFTEINNKNVLLLSALPGKNLKVLKDE
jgi:aminoglycoside phosphotransferase